MDPTACLERMIDALQDGAFDEARSAAQDLLHWIDRDGDPPDFTGLTANETRELTSILCLGVIAGCGVAKHGR